MFIQQRNRIVCEAPNVRNKIGTEVCLLCKFFQTYLGTVLCHVETIITRFSMKKKTRFQFNLAVFREVPLLGLFPSILLSINHR